jgi:hypothetical protein
MNGVSGGVRSDDQNTLNRNRVDLIKTLMGGKDPQPPILPTTKPSALGFNHPATARPLVPIRKLAAYDKNPTE